MLLSLGTYILMYTAGLAGPWHWLVDPPSVKSGQVLLRST